MESPRACCSLFEAEVLESDSRATALATMFLFFFAASMPVFRSQH